ncbi:MAG TPA: alpha/beta hydrolase [Sandaracinaceae bacterium LLY-WYZ-13_1]|nr:alpha/beta hydrolase [Sandaracinaceae bacterium LLY-WYZ-13_1]
MQAVRSLTTLRRRAGAVLVDSFFSGASRLGRMHPLARPERHGVEVIRDVAYAEEGAHERHRLDVYRPSDGPGPWPTVFYVHGGGFRILSKDTHWIMALSFARRGYLVFNVGYRLAPKHPFPAAVEDVAAAYRWMARHGAEYGADLRRLAVAGESAGANLATALTLAATYRRAEPFAAGVFETGVVPRAVLPACGIFQVSDVDRFARRKPGFPRFLRDRLEEVERGYLGREPTRHGPTIDFADPLRWLERAEPPDRPLPPFFLPVGTKDPLLDDTRRLAAAVRAHGAEAEDRYYEGEVHAFHAFPFLRSSRRCWSHTFAFLERHVADASLTPPRDDAPTGPRSRGRGTR